jgi:hypothetical protein
LPNTHYDNLRITHDAPIEVIRAAYRALSLLYHPDRNPGDPQAERDMAAVNAAYAVLSDPEKKREYDEQIRSAEAAFYTQSSGERGAPSRTRPRVSTFRRSRDDSRSVLPQDRWSNYAVWSAVAIVGLLMAIGALLLYSAQHVPRPLASLAVSPGTQTASVAAASEVRPECPCPMPAAQQRADASPASDKPPPSKAAAHASVAASKPIASNEGEDAPAPKRIAPPHEGHPYSDTAPNGEPWPTTSGYVHGFPILNADGGSQLAIDNSKNNFDVFVKLVAVTGEQPKTVRAIFVRAHSQFTARRIVSGTYEARYQQLQSGALMKSATFVFDEAAIAGGTRYSLVTLEVHSAPDETADTYPLSQEEFDP